MIEGQRVYWDNEEGKEETGIFDRVENDHGVINWESEGKSLYYPLKDLRTESRFISGYVENRSSKVRLVLISDNIKALLRQAGYTIGSDFRVSFDVPSGGDYSGVSLDITKDDPIKVEWLSESAKGPDVQS